jgi:hypothetical protein
VSYGSEIESQGKGGGENKSYKEVNIEVKGKNGTHKEVDEKASSQSEVR